MKFPNFFLLSTHLVCLICVTQVVASDLNPALISEWPGGPTGWVSDVAVHGAYAYVSSGGSGCNVLDISDPAAPRRVGFSALKINGATQFSGNYAYVPGASGLEVLDLSDPVKPLRVGSFNTSGNASDVAIVGNYAYVVETTPSGNGALHCINISDATHPTAAGTYALDVRALRIEVSGNRAFVLGWLWASPSNPVDTWTVDCFDISNPAQPQRLGRVQRDGYPHDLALSGQYVYVSALHWELGNAGVQVVDVSDPANPRWVAGYNNNRDTDRVVASSNYLYLVKTIPQGLDIFDISVPASIRKVGAYSGEINGMAVLGNQAYISNNGRLEVVDMSIPATPRRSSSWTPPIGPMDVAHAGNFTYLIGSLGLTTYLNILDTTDSTNPRLTGSLAVSGWTQRIKLLGNYAYIATESALHVVDVTDPKSPRKTGGFTAQQAIHDVALAGDYAFVADQEAGLQLLTITNRASPRRLATFFASASELVYGVCVSSNVACVLKQSMQGPSDTWYGTVSVVDITDPRTLTELSSYQTSGVLTRGTVSGSCLYLTKRYMQIPDPRRWWAGMLEIIDISNPANPQLVSQYETTAEAYTVTVSGGRAYVGCLASVVTDGPWQDGQHKSGGLIVLDVTDPAHPRRVGGSQGHWINSVSIDGDRAYAGGGYYGALQIIDLSRSATLSRIADLDTPDLACGLALSGNQLLVADRLAGVQLVDVSNPLSPKLTANIASSEPVHSVAVSGAIAFAASDSAGIQTFDLTNPANPQPLGSYDTTGTARGITLSGPYAYVADGDAGLQILDVSNPASLQPVGSVETTGFANSVALMGNYALVANWEDGLVVVDISNPRAPRIVGNYNGGGYILCAAVVGSNALIADGSAGFQVLDLSKPEVPKLRGSAPAEGWARSITVSGRFAYVADAFAGVQVYEISDLAHPRRMGGTTAVDPYAFLSTADHLFVAGGRDGLVVFSPFTPPLNLAALPSQTPGSMSLRVDGSPGSSIRVQRSSDFVNWQDWQPVTLADLPVTLTDAIVPGGSQWFYRAVKP